MHGTVIFRSLGMLALCAAFAGCHAGSTRSTAGQTPLPSQTSMAQANSTAAPAQGLSSGPGQKYFAKSGADSNVTFSIWANGKPIGSIMWPNKSMDITKGMRGHANVLVIQWERTKKNGTGTLTIVDQTGKKILSADVTASSKDKGQVSKTMIAPQAPVGSGSSGT